MDDLPIKRVNSLSNLRPITPPLNGQPIADANFPFKMDALYLDSSNRSTSTDSQSAASFSSSSPPAHPISLTVSAESWHSSSLLTIVILGASGDLAKKKTYPSLFNLFKSRLLPRRGCSIYGYARSKKTDEEFRQGLFGYLNVNKNNENGDVEAFLELCFYRSGSSYGDEEAMGRLNEEVLDFEGRGEAASASVSGGGGGGRVKTCNRLFYFAIPANVFAQSAAAIKNKMAHSLTHNTPTDWIRIIVEKPFGHDSESCATLSKALSASFNEQSLYRIDHYLGKEMVQNLMIMRFGNVWFEKLWNRNDVAAVVLTFKEPFGVEGRAGYFDKYGIIRDILQNHLLQVLTLIAMEPPLKAMGPNSGDNIRDAKVAVLKAMKEIKLEDCLLGQYEGYRDDPEVPDDSTTPTFAIVKCFVNTPRWSGVPFILKAGKALNERKAEVRIQFKDAPASEFMFDMQVPRNELVIRLQPREAIYMKTNVKTPGFSSQPIQSELEVDYNTKFVDAVNPDAYTRLILDVLRGKQAAFVRDDELTESWKIFTPLLHRIEKEKTEPIRYQQGSRGPEIQDALVEDWGYIRNEDYVMYRGKVVHKSKI